MGPRHWLWRALAGALILGLPAAALFFIKVPVITVSDIKARRQLLAVQVRAGDSLVLSYRQPVTLTRVAETFEVRGDGTFLGKETSGRGASLPEISFVAHPASDHVIVLKGTSLNLSREVQPGSLVKIRVERRFWWWTWRQKAGALLARIRRST